MPRQRSKVTGEKSYPVAASTDIASGAMVMINSAGYAVTAVAAASNRGVVGIAKARANNSAGAAGAIDVIVEEGVHTVTATGLVQGDLMSTAYASSGTLVSGTQGANEPACGRIVRIRSATSCDVEMSSRGPGLAAV